MSRWVTVEPNGTPEDARYWLGIRTEPQTYCAECGAPPEWCKCEQSSDESEDIGGA